MSLTGGLVQDMKLIAEEPPSPLPLKRCDIEQLVTSRYVLAVLTAAIAVVCL